MLFMFEDKMLISKKNKEPISKYFGIFKDDDKYWREYQKEVNRSRKKTKLKEVKF